MGRRIEGGEGGGVVNDKPERDVAGVVEMVLKLDVDAFRRGAEFATVSSISDLLMQTHYGERVTHQVRCSSFEAPVVFEYCLEKH